MAESIRCPKCGSMNTGTSVDYKIKKGLGYAAEFGIGFLAGRYFGDIGVDLVEGVSIADGVEKEWQCDNCGYTWNAKERISASSSSKLGNAKPVPSSKQAYHDISSNKPTNDSKRAELLKIIYKCDGRKDKWNDEYASIQNSSSLYEELKKYSINISKSKFFSINTYRRLADIILESGWNYSPDKTSKQARPVNDTPKFQTIKVTDPNTGENFEVMANADSHGLREMPFGMKIEDFFYLEGRGTVITGRVRTGHIMTGERVCFKGSIHNNAIVVGIEMSRKILRYAEFNDNVGLLLNGKNGVDFIIEKGDFVRKASEISKAKNEVNNSLKDNNNSTNELEYIEELKECLADGNIGNSERRLLNKLRDKLGISEERAKELETSLQEPQLTEEEQEYLEAFKDAMEDGIVTEKERRLLDKLMKINNISEQRAKEIEKLYEK